MSTHPLVEEAPVDSPATGRMRAGFGTRRLAALGAAVLVGVPATIELARFVTTIVLSLILGH